MVTRDPTAQWILYLYCRCHHSHGFKPVPDFHPDGLQPRAGQELVVKSLLWEVWTQMWATKQTRRIGFSNRKILGRKESQCLI